MRTLPIAKKLPPTLTREIGRVIYAYSRVELNFKTIIYAILNIDPKSGRITVREPRGKEYVDTIQELMIVRGRQPVKAWWKNFRDSTERVRTGRDQVAHGIWLRDKQSRQLLLRITRGSWQPKGKNGKTSRKIIPEGIIFGPSECRKLLAEINGVLSLQNDLRREVNSWLRASRRKSLKRPVRKGRLRHTSAILHNQP